MLSDLDNLRVINCINKSNLDGLRMFLRERGFLLYELDGGQIEDGQSFFTESARVFPQDPPLGGGSPNWDAFIDSVWGGLAILGKDRVAFIWTYAERMLEHGLQDLLIVNGCLEHVATEMNTTKYGLSRPVLLMVFLVGKGDNFKPFEPAESIS